MRRLPFSSCRGLSARLISVDLDLAQPCGLDGVLGVAVVLQFIFYGVEVLTADALVLRDLDGALCSGALMSGSTESAT